VDFFLNRGIIKEAVMILKPRKLMSKMLMFIGIVALTVTMGQLTGGEWNAKLLRSLAFH
jgi:hypothetical protein